MALKQKHMETLRAGIEALYGDKEMADIEIKINSKLFPCHKTVLASQSPYFRSMFTTGMKESREKRITLQDINEVAFEKFLQYVYTGQEDCVGDEVIEVLRLAALFQVDPLQDYCEELLTEQLRVETSLEFYALACMYNCKELKKKAWLMVLDGFCTIWKTEEFDALSIDELTAIIKDDNLVTMDEEHVCEAALKWVNADLPGRKLSISQLFKYIRLPHVSPDYLVDVLCKNSILRENSDCVRLLEEAQHFHLLPARRLDFSHHRTRYRADDELEEVLLVITENDDERGSFYEGGWCLWAFSYHQKRWFTLAPISLTDSPGSHFAVVSHGYDLYLSGGTNNAKGLLKFEAERNEWVSSTVNMKKGRSKHAMAAIGNSLFVLGGINFKLPKANQIVGTIEEFFILGQRWRTLGELPTPVYSATTSVSGENLLVFGGITKDGQATNIVQNYHVRLREGSIISNLPYQAKSLMTTKIGEDIYIVMLEREGSGTLRLTSDYGFEEAGIDLPGAYKILGATHHNENFIFLLEHEHKPGYFGRMVKVNRYTSKADILQMKGNACPKPIHACHRTYVDKRFLYHTYFQ